MKAILVSGKEESYAGPGSVFTAPFTHSLSMHHGMKYNVGQFDLK
jgi:hypothetical protein